MLHVGLGGEDLTSSALNPTAHAAKGRSGSHRATNKAGIGLVELQKRPCIRGGLILD